MCQASTAAAIIPLAETLEEVQESPRKLINLVTDPAPPDVFTSPGDPAFYLHHAMIDRVWWMWQMLSPRERQYGETALGGTNTFLDQPPSANTTMDDYLEYGYVGGEPLQIRDAMSTVAGPFCFVYL